MGKASRLKIPCSVRCADGSPCGRRVTDGSQPPICHIHRAKANGVFANGGQLTSNLPPPDPMVVLQKDMRASEPSVRVRAATEFLAEERRRRAERQEVDADDKAWAAFKLAVNAEEVREMNELMDRMKLLKYRVYQRVPEARPALYVEPVVIATNDYAPGTLFIHPTEQTICEAAPLTQSAMVGTTTPTPSRVNGYATEAEAEAANPTCIAVNFIDGRFFVELPDDEE